MSLKDKNAVVTGGSHGPGLADRAVLVTGANRGIGQALVEEALRRGAKRVYAGTRQPLAHLDGRVTPLTLDVTNAAQTQGAVERVESLDILINNAGIFEPKGFFEIPDADWTRFYEVNVMSGVRLSRAYMPGMLKRDWGRIIFISSESALNIPKEMIHYGMTKTAQLAVSRGLAEMTRGTGVTVNSVLPGPTMSARTSPPRSVTTVPSGTGSTRSAP